jgi:DNA polymerase I-like protein with 3'-5' exonuclease and polymerase domains
MAEPEEEEEVEFSGLFGLKQVVVVDPKPWMEDKTFTLVQSMDQLKEIVDRAIEAGHCALDLETTGLDNRIKRDGTTVDKVVGYCLAFNGDEGIYIPVRHKGDGKPYNMDPKMVVEEIRRLCDNCITIYHNSPFDHEFLYGEGIEVDSFKDFEDTLILDYLRHSSDKRHGLKHLSERFLGMEMIGLKELFPEDVKDRDFSTLDPSSDNTLWYAGSDAICTYLLFQWYREHRWIPKRVKKEFENVDEEGNTYTITKTVTDFVAEPVSDIKDSIYSEQPFAYYIEKINVPALRWMERNRPKIDLEYLARVRFEVDALITETKKEIADGFRSRGLKHFQESDVSSTKKLGTALQYLKDEGYLKASLQETDGGQVQTSDDVIQKLSDKVGDSLPFIKKISTFRKLQKVDGTYLKPLQYNTDGYQRPDGTRNPSHVLQDNTIRFSFLPNRVDTGRYAASKGKPDHGYSGINVQSTPAGYNVGKFSGKRIISRPNEMGDEDAVIYQNLKEFIESGLLIRIYDGHFVTDPLKDEEYCVRATCEGCPFAEQCEYEAEPEWDDDEDYYERNVKILSLDSSVRPAIVARDGYALAAIDQSGVELRLAASIAQEPKWIEEFYRCGKCGTEYEGPKVLDETKPLGLRKYEIPNRPPDFCTTCASDKIGDLHTLTSKIVYGDEVVEKPDFKQYRQKSKGANFAILYGGSGGAVARSTGVAIEEGRFIRKKVLSGLPRLNTWFDEVIARAKKNKEVTTGIGRKIRLPDIDHDEGWIQAKAERNAVNSIIQGTATGDLTKYCMGRIYQYLKQEGHLDDCRLIITVHDELVFEIRKDKMDLLFPKIKELMVELAPKVKWPVPLRCDVEIGPNFNVAYDWGQMHVIDPKTGKANSPVPSWLWNHVELKPGMWYVDEEGNEVVIEGDPEPEPEPEPEPDPEPEEVEPEEEEDDTEEEPVSYSELREFYLAAKETRMSKASNDVQGPVFTYQLIKSPGIVNGDDPSQIKVLFRYIFQILDFFKAEGTGKYALRLLDWQGEVILSEKEKHLVDPEEFLLLARFFGITGEPVR